MTTTAAITERTFLARLTPPGAGAIAALALRGPVAWHILAELFRPLGKTATNPFHAENRTALAPGQFWLGKLGDPASGFGDEVVVSLKSIEPQPHLEIHCHGGSQVVVLLEELFSARGVQVCAWPEFLRHIGRDPLEVAALAELSKATTVRTAAILLDQFHGAFAATVRNILASLQQDQKEQAGKLLAELARWNPLGRHLTHPWRVAIAGAPNVGKSSLINRLAGYPRCIVSPIPGTTRDLVTTRIAIDGWPMELIDTAGIREQAAALESQGIELAQAAAAEADLCLWLLDASAAPAFPPGSLHRYFYVINKIDLAPAWDLAKWPREIRVSAQTGAGLDELVQDLACRLIGGAPSPGAAVPFTSELCQAVELAQADYRQGKFEQVAQRLESCLCW